MSNVSLKIKGMTCASCVARVEKIAAKIDGIENITVNLVTEKLNFISEAPDSVISPLAEKLSDYGYEIVTQDYEVQNKQESEEHQSFSLEFKLALV